MPDGNLDNAGNVAVAVKSNCLVSSY